MTTGNEPPSSSSSTYGVILINPSSLDASRLSPALQNGSSASLVPGPVKHRPPRLLYPIPLVFAAILDVTYSGYHVWQCHESSTGSPSKLLLGLTALRALVLAGICGLSKRWRSRGGWVAASSGISIGAAIWKDCVDQLTGAKLGRTAEESVYLYTTILIAVSEYLLFLVLLRLSPPTYRARPLSLLHPASADQQAVPFAYTSQDAMITPRSTRQRRFSSMASSPLSPHPGMHHRSRLSINTFSDMNGIRPSRGMTTGNDYLSAEQYASAHPIDPTNPYSSPRDGSQSADGDESFSDEYESDYDYDCDSASSISENSIIDLPPPLEPHQIMPPSLSIRSNLAHAIDSSPLLGPIARRSRSMQMLARSFGSVMQGEVADEAMRRMRGEQEEGIETRPPAGSRTTSGYGTFDARGGGIEEPGTA